MQTQEIFATEPQSTFDLGQPSQNGIEFPLSLAERYQPSRVEDFIGLERAKQTLAGLVQRPRACALLFIGPPGAGKTAMAMAFAEQLPGSLHHVSAQKCDVTTLDELKDRFAYCPPRGNFWVCLIDEADQMTEKAQLQLLSRLDGTASLKPKFGGGSERGSALPVIWIFTCNGRGEKGTTPPGTFEPRFLSRCLVVACERPEVAEVTQFVWRIWALEGGDASSDPSPLAEGCDGMRDALTKLEVPLCTGIPPSRPAERRAPALRPDCSGRVRYLAPGQPELDPKEWQFRKLSRKGSRVYVRRCEQSL